jgi:hypothetical protein
MIFGVSIMVACLHQLLRLAGLATTWASTCLQDWATAGKLQAPAEHYADLMSLNDGDPMVKEPHLCVCGVLT